MKKIIAAFAVSCVLVSSIIVPAFAMEWDDSYESVCGHMIDELNSGVHENTAGYYSIGCSDHYIVCFECGKIATVDTALPGYYPPHDDNYCWWCGNNFWHCLDDVSAEELGLVKPSDTDTPDVPDTPVGTSPVSAIGSVFTAAMDWVKTTASVIAHNPVLLVACVAVPLCSLGVGMFIRIKSKSKVRS